MRTVLLSSMMLSILALAALAQDAQKAPLPAPPRAHGPALMGEDGLPVQGVRVAAVDLHAVVHGGLAQATMVLTFANDQPRVLGGNLVFPLPEGATVTGYGLDINGVMVDGVAVEKERARMIYETEIHKRVDPGLVEHVAGNEFRTRLYPIPANGTRSIKIEYVTQIEQAAGGVAFPSPKDFADAADVSPAHLPPAVLPSCATLAMPMGFADVVDGLTLRIDCPEATAAPTVKAGGIEGLAFVPVATNSSDKGFVASATAKKIKTGDELVIGLPELPAVSIAVERRLKLPRTIEDLEAHPRPADPATGFDAFEHYFVVTDTPAPGGVQEMVMKNHHVGVIWDASLSRSEGDHARELKLLVDALNRLGNPEADLIVLRNDVHVDPSFAGTAEGTAKLIAAIKALQYDGATNLGALTFLKNVADYSVDRRGQAQSDYDAFLLFTDGFGNLGADRPLRAEAPVYAISDDIHTNHPLLSSICQESGGRYFNLKRLTDEQVMAAIFHEPFSLVSAECDPKEISDIYPPVGTAVGGRFTASGRLLAPTAHLKLNFGYGKTIVASRDFTISADGAKDGSLLPRFWAQQKVAALSLFPEKHGEELSQLGKQFNLVTPNTSLLVLETTDQYVQYRVVPPTSRPEIYREFLAKIEEHHVQEAKSREMKLQGVVALWNARVQWWEKEYKYPKDLKVKPEEFAANGAPLVASGRGYADPRGTVSGPGDSRPRRLTGMEAPAPTTTPPTSPEALRNEQLAENARLEQASQRRMRSVDAPVASAPANGTRVASGEERLSSNASAVEGIRMAFAYKPDPSGHAADGIDSVMFSATGYDGTRKDSGRGDVLAVAIKPWDPNTPYINAMKAVPADGAYAVYLEQRKAYAHSPAFYLDCADYLVSIGQKPSAVRVLTNIAELELQDARLLRVAAHRLNQIGERELAIDLFEKVLRLRPEEPQSYRDLALSLADRADYETTLATEPQRGWKDDMTARAVADDVRALELLNKIIEGNFDRFPEIELPVLMEANNIAARAGRIPGVHDFHNPIDARLQKNLDCDLRVVMTWDADQTDIDLWVTEPSTEKCFYGHNRTVIGGLLSRDYTDGYGPEEYCLRKLMPGKYVVQANYYGSRQQELTGPATVQATVISNFGRPNEKRQALTLRLKDMKEVVDIGTVTLNGAGDVNTEQVPRPAPAQELNK